MRAEWLAGTGLALILATRCLASGAGANEMTGVVAAPRQGEPRFRFTARTERAAYDCAAPELAPGGRETILASVLAVAGDSFALDACPPTADCRAPHRSDFVVSAPGFAGFSDLLPRDGFVRVQVELRRHGASCRQRLTIESVARWLGAPNPAQHGDGLYFAGSDGFSDAAPDAPFGLEPCPLDAPRGALHLSAPHGAGLTVGPSATVTWLLAGWEWTVRNLSTPGCETAGFSYWIAGRPVPAAPGHDQR